MKHLYLSTLALCLAAGNPAFSAQIDLSKLPPASDKKGLTYDKDIRPLFEASCVRCHGPEKTKGRLRLDSREGVLKGSEHGQVIQAGNSKESKLVAAIAQLDDETAMPPKPEPPRSGVGRRPGAPRNAAADANQGAQANRPQQPPAKPLTAAEIGLVRAWIDQGAK